MRAADLKAVKGGESALAMAKRRYNTVLASDKLFSIPNKMQTQKTRAWEKDIRDSFQKYLQKE